MSADDLAHDRAQRVGQLTVLLAAVQHLNAPADVLAHLLRIQALLQRELLLMESWCAPLTSRPRWRSCVWRAYAVSSCSLQIVHLTVSFCCLHFPHAPSGVPLPRTQGVQSALRRLHVLCCISPCEILQSRGQCSVPSASMCAAGQDAGRL